MFAQANIRRWNPLPVYYLLTGISALLFQTTITIYVVYYSLTAGLDPLQIVLVGTVFESTIFLFEIPTGVVADVYSRRLSVIIGFVLIGAGLLIEGIFPIFGVILLAQIIGGLGATFISGATEAWISDEISVEKANHAFVRGAQIRTLGGMLGAVLGALLASVGLQLPFITAGILLIMLAVCLTVFMPENGFHPTPSDERTSWRTLFKTFRQGLHVMRSRPALLLIVGVAFLFAFHSEGFDQLWQKHILDQFTLPQIDGLNPVIWFGVIAVVANLLGIITTEVVRRLQLKNAAHVLTILYSLMTMGILIFALANNFGLALMAYWLALAARNASEPVSHVWLNQHAAPETRATLFSMVGQIGAVGEVIGGIPIGALGRLSSVRVSLVASGAILGLAVVVLVSSLKPIFSHRVPER